MPYTPLNANNPIARATSIDDVKEYLAYMAGETKRVMGVCFYLVRTSLFNTVDLVEKTPLWHNRTTRARFFFTNAKKLYSQQAEHRLLYARVNRFFHVDDMSEEMRKMWRADLTDADYFQWWQDASASAVSRQLKEWGVLRHKLILFMKARNATYPEACAEAWLTIIALEKALSMWEDGICGVLARNYHLPSDQIKHIFSDFYIPDVYKAFRKAASLLMPDFHELHPLIARDHNIRLSIDQWEQQFAEQLVSVDACLEALEDNADDLASKAALRFARRDLRETEADHRAAIAFKEAQEKQAAAQQPAVQFSSSVAAQ